MKRQREIFNENKRQIVLLLVYRTLSPTPMSPRFVSFAKVARHVNMTYNKVYHICHSTVLKHVSGTKKSLSGDRSLSQDHLDYLLSLETLRLWAGLTMKDRIQLFERKFPGKRISESKLRRVYLKHGVRRKEIKVRKLLPQSTVTNFVE